MHQQQQQLDTFTRAYVLCALWTFDENPGQGEWSEHDDCTIGHLAPGTLARMREDCARFLNAMEFHFQGDDENAGHDFWLTRNGHGAGFWDGGWPEPAASLLTQAAKSFGMCELYRGDDGLIYC